MNKKQTIRLNESDFNRLIKETVKRVLRESEYNTLEDNVRKFKQVADEIVSGFEEEELSADYNGGEFDEYFNSLYRLAKEVSENTESLLAIVYNEHPRVIY